MIRPLLTKTLFSKSFNAGSATWKVCDPAFHRAPLKSVLITFPTEKQSIDTCKREGGYCDRIKQGRSALIGMSERYRSYGGIHVEDLRDFLGHLNHPSIAKVDGVALLRSFFRTQKVRSISIDTHASIFGLDIIERTEPFLLGRYGHIYRLGRKTTNRRRSRHSL